MENPDETPIKKKIVKKSKMHDRRKGATKDEQRKAHIERIAGNMAKFYGKKGDSVAEMRPKSKVY
jgi:hypothetical protein